MRVPAPIADRSEGWRSAPKSAPGAAGAKMGLPGSWAAEHTRSTATTKQIESALFIHPHFRGSGTYGLSMWSCTKRGPCKSFRRGEVEVNANAEVRAMVERDSPSQHAARFVVNIAQGTLPPKNSSGRSCGVQHGSNEIRVHRRIFALTTVFASISTMSVILDASEPARLL